MIKLKNSHNRFQSSLRNVPFHFNPLALSLSEEAHGSQGKDMYANRIAGKHAHTRSSKNKDACTVDELVRQTIGVM
jgi:hypothetical protein